MNGTVSEWIEKAEKDYRSANLERSVGHNANHDLVCFLSQQCIEKLMKATLIHRRTTPPRTHDLVELHKLLSEAVRDWSADPDVLRDLSMGAVDYRYPGEAANRDDAEWAFSTCGQLRAQLHVLLGIEAPPSGQPDGEEAGQSG